MPSILAFTPQKPRAERFHGQGIYSYGEVNAPYDEQVIGQFAPDPIRQSDTPSRPSRRQIVITSSDPATWQYAFAGGFIPYHHRLTARNMAAGRQAPILSNGAFGTRPNIERPPAVAYGSLFQLSSPTYDLVR